VNVRLSRLLASNSDISKVYNIKNKEFRNLALFFYDMGQTLNDNLGFKLAMLSSGVVTGEGARKLILEVSNIINPESEVINSQSERNLPVLMKELENTIVTFNKESYRQAKAAAESEKMRI